MGILITGISVLGIVLCTILLLVSGKIFAKQRKDLLKTIEME